MQNTHGNNIEKNSSTQNVLNVINNRGMSPSRENNPFRLMVNVCSIEREDDHLWLSGYRLGGLTVKRNPREVVKVRLNTVAERVEDEKLYSKKSANEIKNSVKSLYETGANKRKTLYEHQKSQTKMLSFERVIYLHSKDGIKHYRAHWSTCMSTNQNAHFIQGMAHVRMIQEDERIGRKSTCQVEIIEKMIMGASKDDAESNNNFIAKALDSTDPTSKLETAERTGKLMVELVSNGVRNTRTIDIYSEKTDVVVVHPQTGEQITVRRAVPYAETLKAFLTGEDYHTSLFKADPNNAYKRDKAFDADIQRHILGYLLGIDAKTIPIAREDMADDVLKPFVNSLYRKEVTLNLSVVRIYQYGSRYRVNALNDSIRKKLHVNYAVALNETGVVIPYHETEGLPATPAYAPTAIAVQRYEDGTAYVVFEGAVEMKKDFFQVSSSITPESVDAVKDFSSVALKD